MQKQDNLYGIIMAGGIGSRFWPMSRQNFPKQFIDILGTGETLLQATFRRLSAIIPSQNIIIVTNNNYLQLVKEQLPKAEKINILGEPARKNTAPCIAYACYKVLLRQPEAQCFVAPSDHLITNENAYYKMLENATQFVQNNSSLLTIGITPTRPDTGYGYIQYDTRVENKKAGNTRKVRTFTEKPNKEMAEKFLQSGEFAWNSGMFLWKAKDFIAVYRKYLPEDAALFEEVKTNFDTEKEQKSIQKVYSMVKNISVDYGIMEKADNVYVQEANIGWSDLGTWGSLYEKLSEKQKGENVIIGDNVLSYDSKGCIVNIPKDKIAVLNGIKNLIVAEYDNALFVCKRGKETSIKQILSEIRIEKGEKFT